MNFWKRWLDNSQSRRRVNLLRLSRLPNQNTLERGFIMYIIQYLDAALTYDRRRKHAYFMGFYKGKFREYGKKADAMKFCTKAEAEAFLRDVLGDRKDHKVIKTA